MVWYNPPSTYPENALYDLGYRRGQLVDSGAERLWVGEWHRRDRLIDEIGERPIGLGIYNRGYLDGVGDSNSESKLA